MYTTDCNYYRITNNIIYLDQSMMHYFLDKIPIERFKVMYKLNQETSSSSLTPFNPKKEVGLWKKS
jgi:hypothetical protein